MQNILIVGFFRNKHTSGFVHYGFHKGFKSLGCDTYWIDADDELAFNPPKDAIILTEGQVDYNIPVRKDLKYVLHNCRRDKYPLSQSIHIVVPAKFNYYHIPEKPEYIENKKWLPWNNDTHTLVLPWATDLLPEEINFDNIDKAKNNTVHYVGTVTEGTNNSIIEAVHYAKALKKYNVNMVIHGGYTGDFQYDNLKAIAGFISVEEAIRLVSSSWQAPVLQGEWQRDQEYIPCRAFKNISYGFPLLTNSEAIANFFSQQEWALAGPELVELGMELSQDRNNIMQLMKLVKEEHTYKSRVQTILNLFKQI